MLIISVTEQSVPAPGTGQSFNRGPLTDKPVCPWRNECPKARKEEEAPTAVGFADLEIK